MEVEASIRLVPSFWHDHFSTRNDTKMILNGDIETVDESLVAASDPKRQINYLPQLMVQRCDKLTSKVRPVFNASSRNNQIYP